MKQRFDLSFSGNNGTLDYIFNGTESQVIRHAKKRLYNDIFDSFKSVEITRRDMQQQIDIPVATFFNTGA